MSSEMNYDGLEAADYGDSGDTRFAVGSRPNSNKRKKPEQGRKRGKAPSSFNGMHRRRRRKMAW